MIKKSRKRSIGKDLEKLKSWCIASRDIKRCVSYRKQYCSSPKESLTESLQDPAFCFWVYAPKN